MFVYLLMVGDDTAPWSYSALVRVLTSCLWNHMQGTSLPWGLGTVMFFSSYQYPECLGNSWCNI